MKNCIDCEKEIKNYHAKRCRLCYKKFTVGKNHPTYGIHRFGENSPNWKGGLPKCSICGKTLTNYSFDKCRKCSNELRIKNNQHELFTWKGGEKSKEEKSKLLREWRHKKGINKRFNDGKGISHTKEYLQLMRKKYKYNKKQAGKLLLRTIQLVYEDNIKKYGTLTCYLCLNPIPFGKDNLEHRIPLSRKGTNEYSNLAIACQKCNCKKHNKTEEEFRKGAICLKDC